MQFMTRFVAALAIAFIPALAFAASGSVYSVSARLSDAGRTFATPSVVVLADEPARVEMSGADRYVLTLTVSDLAADEIRVLTSIESVHGSMAPSIVVRPGQPATVTVGDLGLELTVTRGER